MLTLLALITLTNNPYNTSLLKDNCISPYNNTTPIHCYKNTNLNYITLNNNYTLQLENKPTLPYYLRISILTTTIVIIKHITTLLHLHFPSVIFCSLINFIYNTF